MTQLIATEGNILYKSLIRDSLRSAGYTYKKDDPCAVVVWYDNLRKKDFYSSLKPWQIVNRLPMVNVICRKAPFVRLIQRTALTFPSQYKFLPQSFILPIQKDLFDEELRKKEKRFIIKPDRGSLGEGIKIVEIGDEVPTTDKLSVAQEYIPSFHIDDYKFDLRIYALVASIDPLRIYVYKDGVARFCSKKSFEKSIFAELTNKTLNKKNPEMEITKIVRLVSDVMNRLEREGHDINRLWQRIERAIVSTIITATHFLRTGMEKQCPRTGFQHCFQILGFDVLLDTDLNPYVLEVNYRPSLETNASYERRMKTSMLADALRIIAPSQRLQAYVNEHYSEDLADRWPGLCESDPVLKAAIEETVALAESGPEDLGGFVRAFPTANERQMRKWERMIEFVARMPTELRSRYFLPQALKKPTQKIEKDESPKVIE